MHKDEAKQLIGHEVVVNLEPEGAYVGTLLEVKGAPWRSRICVTGIEEPAQHSDFETGGFCRRGYRVGEFVDAPGPRIEVAKTAGYPSYKEALQAALGRQTGSHALSDNQDHTWTADALTKGLGAAILAEERRERTGRWFFEGPDAHKPYAGGSDEE